MTKIEHTANGSLQHKNDTSHTIEELHKFPLVKDTVELVKNNKYTGFFVNRAASAVSTVAGYATPVTTKFQDQIDAADRFVAQQVGNAGSYLPLLHKPTDELVGGAKTYASSAAAMVDRSVAEPVRRTASTAYGKVQPIALAADARLSPVTRAYAQTIDTYMPSGGESESEAEDHDSATQAFRLVMLSLKAQRRLSRRVKAQLSTTAHYTEKQIKQLQDSTALLQKTTETVNQLNGKLLELLLFAKENAAHLKDKVQNPEELRIAITERFQSIVAQTEVISKYVRENAVQFPDYVQERLHPMIDYFNNSYSTIVAEIQKSDGDVVKKAYNLYKLTEQQTIPVLKAAKDEMSKTLTYVSVSVNNTAENARAYVASTPVARSLGVTN